MNKRIFSLGLIFVLSGAVSFLSLGSLASMIQDNFYSQPNGLMFLYLILGRPLYLTTFVYPVTLGIGGFGLCLMLFGSYSFEDAIKIYRIFLIAVYVISIGREIWQYLNWNFFHIPGDSYYFDQNGLDILAGTLAFMILMLIIWRIKSKYEEV